MTATPPSHRAVRKSGKYSHTRVGKARLLSGVLLSFINLTAKGSFVRRKSRTRAVSSYVHGEVHLSGQMVGEMKKNTHSRGQVPWVHGQGAEVWSVCIFGDALGCVGSGGPAAGTAVGVRGPYGEDATTTRCPHGRPSTAW